MVVTSLKGAIMLLKEKPTFRVHFKEIAVSGYEHVYFVTHKNLKAFIAIHNTTLGPALGGIRIYPYPSEEAALEDVLRLSKGMTYKAAIAEVGFGGGKSVIIANPKKDKTDELLFSFAEAVNLLKGRYIAAEDSGCTIEDIGRIRQKTPYVVGLAHKQGSGDPSRFTAWGTFRAIQSVFKKLYGCNCVEGKTIAVQGIGSVGTYLIDYLFWAGAHLVVSDLDREKVEEAVRRYKAKAVDPDKIFSVPCDVFSPCAMGGVINDRTVEQFRCKAIAGSANNQLLTEEHARQLQAKKILYAPDFVANAGGLLNVASELGQNGYDPSIPREKTHQIYDSLLGIYKIAEENGTSPVQAAHKLAEYRLQYGIGKRTAPPVFLNV